MDKARQYAVYPQAQPFSLSAVQVRQSRLQAFELASERARAGEAVQVDMSEDNFVTFKVIARINAVPTEDLL